MSGIDDVIMDWFMDDTIDPQAGISLAKMTVAAGVTSELHHHTNCAETLHLIEGEIEQRIGDEWRIMTAGDTCVIPAFAKHQTRNLGQKPAILMVAYSAGRRVYVKG